MTRGQTDDERPDYRCSRTSTEYPLLSMSVGSRRPGSVVGDADASFVEDPAPLAEADYRLDRGPDHVRREVGRGRAHEHLVCVGASGAGDLQCLGPLGDICPSRSTPASARDQNPEPLLVEGAGEEIGERLSSAPALRGSQRSLRSAIAYRAKVNQGTSHPQRRAVQFGSAGSPSRSGATASTLAPQPRNHDAMLAGRPPSAQTRARQVIALNEFGPLTSATLSIGLHRPCHDHCPNRIPALEIAPGVCQGARRDRGHHG